MRYNAEERIAEYMMVSMEKSFQKQAGSRLIENVIFYPILT